MKTEFQKLMLPLYFTFLCAALLTGCQKDNSAGDTLETSTESRSPMSLPLFFGDETLEAKTVLELQQARASSARYLDIKNAIKDGYADLDVNLENMGHHFMKSGNVDGVFDLKNPEILVYNRNEAGEFELVAVEYAVPLNLAPAEGPDGFTGNADSWDRNTTFGLWLLHAWVWKSNPDGVFNPTNPLVTLH